MVAIFLRILLLHALCWRTSANAVRVD